MMNTYDEDLTENEWYMTLCEKHADLHSRATNERWMICIPRIGSWKKSIEDGDLFSQKSFESHILKPVLVYSADGTSTNSSENKYITFNGKEVFIQGSKIICGNGFSYNFNKPSYSKQSEKLALNVESCHTSHIHFEETFFNQNDESYIVLCISEPLEPHLVLHKSETEASEEASQIRPRRDLYGSYLWERSSNPMRLQQLIDEKISQFILHPKVYNEDVSDDVIQNDVKATAESVVNFLTVCLHIILRDSKLKKLSETAAQREPLKTAIEGYVLHGINRTVTGQLNNILASQDSSLNKVTRNLSSITLSDLSVGEQFWSYVPRARRELSMINRYRTPKEKLTALQNAIACLSSKPKDRPQLPVESPGTPVEDKSIGEDAVAMRSRTNDAAMSTDDLLPILIYLVIKCEVPNWLSNLAYLKHFNFSKCTQDQSWFYIATLEAALEHVKHERIEVSKIGSFKKQNSSDELEHFFSILKSGEIDALKRTLRQAEAIRSLQEHDKCHPLCECSKCMLLSERETSGNNLQDIGTSSRDEKGRTPLHIIAITGKHELVDVLVSFGADLNSSDYHGATPLHLAAQEGNQSVIFLLLHYGSNPNAEDNNNNTPLHLASLGGHETCVKALLYYDPVSTVVRVNAVNDVGDSALHIASKWGYVNIVISLMEYGADPHLTNKRKVTPFNLSLNSKVSQALRNTDVDNPRLDAPAKATTQRSSFVLSKAPSKKAVRPLIVAKTTLLSDEDKTYKQVEKLLRAVTDNDLNMVSYVCAWDSNTSTGTVKCHPLCQCFKCQPPSQDVCLHANSTDKYGSSPLLLASKLGYVEMVELLLNHGAKVGVKTKQKGHSPLHLAAQYGHVKIVKKLLDKGAVPDVRDADGNTPIYMCAMNGHLDCTTALLQHGASVNLRNRRGDSPLHEAVRWRHSDAACLLISFGALDYYKNDKGCTALDMSMEDEELYDCLSKALRKHDIFSGADSAADKELKTTSADQIDSSSSNPKSLSKSEADELIADDLYDCFQKSQTPSTPPMIEAAIFDDDEANSEFRNASTENLTLNLRQTLSLDLTSESLSIKLPEDDAAANDRCPEISVVAGDEAAVKREHFHDEASVARSEHRTGDNSVLTASDEPGPTAIPSISPVIGHPTACDINVAKSMNTVSGASSHSVVREMYGNLHSDDVAAIALQSSCHETGSFEHSDNSQSKASYFEISPKILDDVAHPACDDAGNNDVVSEVVEQLQADLPEVQLTKENKLARADNAYLSLNNKLTTINKP